MGLAFNLPMFILAERFADKFHDNRRILAHLLLVVGIVRHRRAD